MKKIKTILSTLFAVMITAGMAAAQTHSTTPSWIASKPVSKIANKKLFEDHRLSASHIVATSITHPDKASTKAVHRAHKSSAEGNIPSKGYPIWTISKPVHRLHLSDAGR